MSSTPSSKQHLHNTLSNPSAYPHPADKVTHISTHISDIYLTGEYVYKVKKPVKFGFLDFSTLALRKHYCEEEIRLNQRFAPELYLRVVPLSVQDGKIQPDNGHGEIIEYAVLMRQFDRSQELDLLLRQQKLTPEHITELAEVIAAFHRQIPSAAPDSEFGNQASVIQPVRDNFTDLYRHPHSAELQQLLEQTEAWVEQEWIRTKSIAETRKQQGFIRECHGDLHLGNIAVINGKVTPFDGIEFNPSLYWIDVMSELAFPLMDLDSRQQPQLASELLNHYLSHSGDYAGLQILNLYRVHRALVRAKINALQAAQQADDQQRRQFTEQTGHYAALAARYTQRRTPVIFITHGLSGSGKTWQSRQIAAQINAIHIRSDVERKRRFAQNTENLYSTDVTRQTYQYLAELAENTIRSGFSVIIDATFLDYRQRALFQQLAEKLQTRCLILHFSAPEEQLRDNIKQRRQQGTDASDADLKVLENQLENYQPLAATEDYLTIQFGQELPVSQIRKQVADG
ncbi:MAG: AAA family ATPase [Thiolinea sp.]